MRIFLAPILEFCTISLLVCRGCFNLYFTASEAGVKKPSLRTNSLPFIHKSFNSSHPFLGPKDSNISVTFRSTVLKKAQ
jgi:hypothetical protein